VAIITQTAFAAADFSKKCQQEIANIINAERDFDMADFAKNLATTVAKVQGAAAIAKIPVLGIFFGPGADDEATDIGITIGCAKQMPKEPPKIKSLLQEIVAEKVKNAASSKFGTSSNIPGNGKDISQGEGLSQVSSNYKISSDFDVASTAETFNIFSDFQTSEVFNNSKAHSSPKIALVAATLTDSRNGKSYKTAVIGNKIWMIENLNYAANSSVCYGNNPTNCAKYGRLYNWATAMTACPVGWHLPSRAEWDVLSNFVGGSSVEGKHLKAKEGWNNNGNGEDTFGFAALPGGYGYSGDLFGSAGYYGYWWSASESSSNSAYLRDISSVKENAYWGYINKDFLFSVRCIQD
jgi:uncharacterized protein (TIGR02145 family)